MSTLDRFSSLDETIATIRAEHADEIKAAKDALLAAQIEATMLRDRIAVAIADRDQYMRLATKLITQFGTVEAVFAEAKALALAHKAATEETAEEHRAAASPPQGSAVSLPEPEAEGAPA